MSQVRQSSLFGGLLHVLQALTKVVALFLESLKDLLLCVLLQSLGNASILQTKNLKKGQFAFSFQMTNSYPPSKMFKMDAIKTFIAMSCDCIFPRDPVLERLHRFKMIAYCSFPRLRNPGCLLLVASVAVLWENAVPSESFLARLRRRLQHFHDLCKFFFFSRGTVLLWCAGFVRRDLVRQTFWMFSKYLPASVVLKIIHLLLFDFWSPYSFVSFQWLSDTIDNKSQSKSHDNSAG